MSEWVSQWVTDMGRLWSDLGPIKILDSKKFWLKSGIDWRGVASNFSFSPWHKSNLKQYKIWFSLIQYFIALVHHRTPAHLYSSNIITGWFSEKEIHFQSLSKWQSYVGWPSQVLAPISQIHFDIQPIHLWIQNSILILNQYSNHFIIEYININN